MDNHQDDYEKMVEEDGDGEGGWLDTHHFASEFSIYSLSVVVTFCTGKSLLVTGM